MEEHESDLNHDAFVNMLNDHLKRVDSVRKKREQKANDYEKKIQEKLRQRQIKHKETFDHCEIEAESDSNEKGNSCDIISDELIKEELYHIKQMDDALSNNTSDQQFKELAAGYIKEIKKKKEEISMDDAKDLLLKYREREREC